MDLILFSHNHFGENAKNRALRPSPVGDSMIYRPDIDGLRALAVLAVFLFHAHVAPFTGGFVGVDVFFVISGYLIASILTKDLSIGRYRYFGFLYRRARRIVPALLVMVITTIPFAWAWLLPRYMVEYGKTFVPSALFYPNIQLSNNVHYAASTIDTHPLIHTWTLGVEAQFYLLFPILFSFLYRKLPKALPYALFGLAGLSFTAMLWNHYANPVSTFFLFHYRAWEFLAGALVATSFDRPKIKFGGILAMAGLAMVLTAVFALDKNTPFPSAIALLPVAGTALVIGFSTPGSLVFRVLSFKPVVALGLISYSFYLWHQPVLVFARMRTIGDLSSETIAALFIFLLALSYLSWRFVEKYFRGSRRFDLGAKLLQGLAVGAVVVAGVVLKAQIMPGWGAPDRFAPEVVRALAGRADYPMMRTGCLNGGFERALPVSSPCRLGIRSEGLDFILIGDSFAEALAPGVSLAAEGANKSGLFWGVAACPPLIGVTGSWFSTRNQCATFKNEMVDRAAALNPDLVILHGLWVSMNNPALLGAPDAGRSETISLFGGAMRRTITAFREAGMEVVVIFQRPATTFFVPERLAKMALFGVEDELLAPMPHNWYDYPMNIVLHDPDVMQGITTFDPTSVFCDASTCQIVIDGHPLIRDRGHMTGFAAQHLAPYIQEAIWP